MKRDVVVARSSEPLYAELDALVAAGDAVLLGERYLPDGERAIAVTPLKGRRPNPEELGSIRIGREFFTTALRDYEDWREKWWREAIQNAVDAGASKIMCGAGPVSGEGSNWLVSCEDDGTGMSREVLLDKFLVLGATTKGGISTTGGFGKAKELLVLPWLNWTITSRDVFVIGEGVDYRVEEAPETLDGTRITVEMPADQHTHDAAALAFIGKCLLPGVRFAVNGQRTRAKLKVGDPVQSFAQGAELYYSKKTVFAQRLLVRSNGLYMFDRWVSDQVEGQLILELTRPSVELLTANRDGFRDFALRREVDAFANRLAADVKSALRKKKGLVRKKFQGTGKFSAADNDALAASVIDSLGVVEPLAKKGRKLVLSGEQITAAVEVLELLGGAEQPERAVPEGALVASEAQPAPPLNFRVSAELATAMLSGTEMLGTDQVEAAARQLSWEPDFFLINEVEGWRVPRRFYPEEMAPNVRRLVRFWAELCRFVLIQLGSEKRYGVGLNFDDDVGATHVHDDDGDWLLLNPIRGADPRRSQKIFRLSSREDAAWLYAAAVHECTHMADGITYHDESFAAAMTRNVARTSGKERALNAIRKAVLGAEREIETARPKATGVLPAEERLAERVLKMLAQGRAQDVGVLDRNVGKRGGYQKSVTKRFMDKLEREGWVEPFTEDTWIITNDGYDWYRRRERQR